MEIAEHIAVVEREGQRLAEVATATSLDATVPTCPEWTLRDLVRHIGGIHFWARTIISEARARPFDPYAQLEGNWPADDVLVDWFSQGHAALVAALKTAPPDLQCFAFLPAPSPKAFWARRQAHETGMHRVDAERAVDAVTPFATDQAVDGIDELLLGFMARPGQKLKSETPRILALRATDADADWRVHIGTDEPVVMRNGGDDAADCRVAGPASDLFRLLWNRRSRSGLDVTGDSSLLDLWQQTVQIHWR
ncbi:MAG: maleylpyruvate isomerase family mycothiol-dependent enzyme [Chloroflexi bacterium]|nr:maleylpyruvate isomerase family mycothiol-dependent enzyme [Chloroflexota bacterium]